MNIDELNIISTRELAAFTNSLYIAIPTTLIALLIGGLIALGVVTKPRWEKHVSILLFINLLIPPFFHALAWQNLFDKLALYDLILPDQINLIRSIPGIVLVLTIAYIPLAYFIILTSLKQISTNVIDSGRIYTSLNQLIRKIILPTLKPAIFTAGILIFLITFNTFDVPGFYEVNVFTTEIFSQFSSHYNHLRAIGLSLIPVGLTLGGLTLVFYRFWQEKPLFAYQIPDSNLYPQIFADQRRLILTARMLLILTIILGVCFPLLSFLLNSNLYTMNGVRELIMSQDVIINTINLAYLGSPILLITGVIAVLYRRYRWLRILLMAMLAMPGVTFGIIAIFLFNQPFLTVLYTTPVILFVTYAIRFMPIVGEVFYARLQQIHPHLIQAGRIYATSKQTLIRRIIWPLFKPTALIVLALGIWLIATELVITLLLQPPGFQAIMSRLFILLHYGSEELMNSLTIILVVICVIPFIITGYILKRDPAY